MMIVHHFEFNSTTLYLYMQSNRIDAAMVNNSNSRSPYLSLSI